MEETLVLKRNKNQNKVMRSFYFKIYSLGKEKKILSLFTQKYKKNSVFHFKQYFKSRVPGNPFNETCVCHSNSQHCPTLRCMQNQIFGKERSFVK